MTTIKDLKQQAANLGLTNEHVKTFGKLSAKTTWQAAIDAHLATTEPVETIALLPNPWDGDVKTTQPATSEQPVLPVYQLCLPMGLEPVEPSPEPQPEPLTATPPTLAVLLIVAFMVLFCHVLTTVKDIYLLVRSAIARRRNESQRRQQWYSDLRQLMTTV
ncbi:hypothetical protein A6770_28470 [Nostoc minutum NIES-26]|uniref:Uncharacterized protein n=1 Tax=Nostoc minutum NIES-26 TaxID=1844469 RepID=A0A367QJQ6_9NOSO|nr:hypothetical protein A6770_28470 [Nostoc minutum NIES-26]